ncbi:hypothetical protein FACS189431_0980 [Alphaproteobacteria bacterium]|nr:hypothetical protein FACS189431_0980 [Alphaproteobacteria bacterium]
MKETPRYLKLSYNLCKLANLLGPNYFALTGQDGIIMSEDYARDAGIGMLGEITSIVEEMKEILLSDTVRAERAENAQLLTRFYKITDELLRAKKTGRKSFVLIEPAVFSLDNDWTFNKDGKFWKHRSRGSRSDNSTLSYFDRVREIIYAVEQALKE